MSDDYLIKFLTQVFSSAGLAGICLFFAKRYIEKTDNKLKKLDSSIDQLGTKISGFHSEIVDMKKELASTLVKMRTNEYDLDAIIKRESKKIWDKIDRLEKIITESEVKTKENFGRVIDLDKGVKEIRENLNNFKQILKVHNHELMVIKKKNNGPS